MGKNERDEGCRHMRENNMKMVLKTKENGVLWCETTREICLECEKERENNNNLVREKRERVREKIVAFFTDGKIHNWMKYILSMDFSIGKYNIYYWQIY